MKSLKEIIEEQSCQDPRPAMFGNRWQQLKAFQKLQLPTYDLRTYIALTKNCNGTACSCGGSCGCGGNCGGNCGGSCGGNCGGNCGNGY